MRIIHIIPNLAKGGAERIVLDICGELQKNSKLEVLLITFSKENTYTFLTEKINWKVIPSSITPSISGKTSSHVSNLQHAIEEFEPDIIHSHLFETEMVLSAINYPKARYFVHFHNNMPQLRGLKLSEITKKHLWTDFYERILLYKSYKKRKVQAITISEDSRNYASNVLPKNVSVHLLHNSINRERFYAEVRTESTQRAVMTGSLVQNKGQILALETIHLLAKRGINVQLDLLGEGPDRKELETYIAQNNLAELVTLHGNVDHPEDFLKNADFYLHTAHREAFGLVMVEAMSAGLPIICTDGGGNRDLILEGKNGFMIQERSTKLLADKVEYLIQNPDKRIEMGEFAQNFSQQFDIANYVEKLLELYSE
ncbi:MAG: glycosyltransferase family 4 protein [Crocinitomicaceae bacterium]|nr:glycosyltransferase family 4 protein [Flavobacteriales bacterium]NQZ37286.1 glycosyltransferase family 4 protein [Crocinitomicaceae bacterium]